MALSDITSGLSLLISLMDKLVFIALCFFFGNLAYKGWKGKKSLMFRLIIVVIIGLVCFFGGLIIQDLMGWSFFASEYISSIIAAVISYLLLLLISSGFKVKENYVTKKDVSSLVNDIRALKIQVAKLTKALEDKKMMPDALDEESIKKCLKKELEAKGIKKYELLKITKLEDLWSCLIKSSKGRREVFIDAYTGSITELKIVNNPFEFLWKKPLSTLGIILFILFITFLGMNVSLTTVNAFNEAFDFSFLFAEPLPEGCLTTGAVLENYASTQVSISPNSSRLSELLSQHSDAPYLIESMTRGARVNSETYYITLSYPSLVSDLTSEITVTNWSNIYELRACVFKSDYTLCECIGGGQTDPVFTVPYLVQLGFIEDALQNMILGSLSGAMSSLFN